jgi:hypothetical protein
MNPHRRQFLHLAAGAAGLPALPRNASAQVYPTRPVRWIVPTAPAEGTDIVARLIGQWLSERLGRAFVIENRPGAGTNIGTEVAVRAPPDGYTLVSATVANAINATLYEKLKFNFVRDIAPVASIARVPNVMEVNPSFPAKTVPEFIAYAKAHPGEINYGSSGNGTTPHLSGELFKMMTGVNIVHVPYRSAAAALTDLLGGQVQVVPGADSCTAAKVTRFGSLSHHAAARHLHFRVVAHQKCDDARHDWTGRQYHQAERYFASRVLDPANGIRADKAAEIADRVYQGNAASGSEPVRKPVGSVQNVGRAAYPPITPIVRATAARTGLPR